MSLLKVKFCKTIPMIKDLRKINVSVGQDTVKEIQRDGTNPNDKPWKGDQVFVHYTGYFENGSNLNKYK